MSKDCKFDQNKNIFYQRVLSVCETKLSLDLSRQCFFLLFQRTKHTGFQPLSKVLKAPRGLVTVLIKTRCFLYVNREWRVCAVVSCRYNFSIKKLKDKSQIRVHIGFLLKWIDKYILDFNQNKSRRTSCFFRTLRKTENQFFMT